jgi:hypothetical protein
MNIFIIPSIARKVILLVCLAAICGAASTDQPRQINLKEDWGIEPVLLRVTADGYMIEFRYKVLDTEKALVLSDRKFYPHLNSVKSRARLSVVYGPTVGVLKSNRKFLKLGKNYNAMFSNEGRHLLPGDKVQIQVKDMITPELTLK